jgi:hypothetical protein
VQTKHVALINALAGPLLLQLAPAALLYLNEANAAATAAAVTGHAGRGSSNVVHAEVVQLVRATLCGLVSNSLEVGQLNCDIC